jgi:TrkA domain protein
VIRGEKAHPAPGPEFRIAPGDTLVVVGTLEGIKDVDEILTAG